MKYLHNYVWEAKERFETKSKHSNNSAVSSWSKTKQITPTFNRYLTLCIVFKDLLGFHLRENRNKIHVHTYFFTIIDSVSAWKSNLEIRLQVLVRFYEWIKVMLQFISFLINLKSLQIYFHVLSEQCYKWYPPEVLMVSILLWKITHLIVQTIK